MSLDDALTALEALGKQQQTLTQGIKHLRVIEAWALDQQPIKAGDAVTIKQSFPPVGEGNGWTQFREALIHGATGIVTDVTYNEYHHYWGASFRPDVLWSWFNSEPMLDDPKLFYISVKHLRPRRESDQGVWPPQGALTWEQARERDRHARSVVGA